MPTILRARGVEPPAALPGFDPRDAGARRTRVSAASDSIHDLVPGDPAATLRYRWCIARDWKLPLRGER